ncbi:MAG TPA: pyridoxamine 5'-phosphate oxidase family protein [Acidimicrobiales bacterium]|nr:pyridoxamine 5'-phosphate oxidase family protein [Acidimicrobiales bacterium]
MDPSTTRTDDAAILVPLPAEECWRLLGGAPIGRIGVITRHEPEIYPVNHIVDRETIVFRVGPSDALLGLSMHPRVSFEVDGVDPDRRTGWSVLVKGEAEVHYEPDALRRPTTQPVEPWPDGDRTRWIRILPTEITGRRIRRTGGAPVDEARTESGAAPAPTAAPAPAAGSGPADEVTPATPVPEAAASLAAAGGRAIVVSLHGIPVGVLTAEALAEDAATAPGATVEEVMDIELVKVGPHDDEITTLHAFTEAAWLSLLRRRPGLSADTAARP